nr:DBF4-type zinc finger-containing protein 2 homolog [Equus caballus]
MRPRHRQSPATAKGGAGAALGGGRGRTPPQSNRPAPPLRRLPSGGAETSRPAEKPAPGPAPSGAALGGQAGLSVVRTEGSAPQAVSLSLARACATPHRRKGPPPGPAPSGAALGSEVRGLRVVRGGGLRTPTRLGCRSGSSPLYPLAQLTPAAAPSLLRTLAPRCGPLAHPCVSSPTAVSPSLLGPLPHSCPPRSPVHPRRSPVQPPRSLLRPLPHSCLPRSLLRPLAYPCIPFAHSCAPSLTPASHSLTPAPPRSSLHPPCSLLHPPRSPCVSSLILTSPSLTPAPPPSLLSPSSLFTQSRHAPPASRCTGSSLCRAAHPQLCLAHSRCLPAWSSPPPWGPPDHPACWFRG